jgi:di/tricarboxylate transporter
MSLQGGLVLLIFASTIAALIRFQRRPVAIFCGVILVLFTLNLVSGKQVIASLANEGLISLVLLILCSIALEKTRLLRFVAAGVIRPSLKTTWLRLFSVVAISSALLNNTAVVATLLAPIRNNPYHNATRLLIPLSYAAILGGTLTLIGTSTNLIVSSMYSEQVGQKLGFFDFTAIGTLLVLGCGLTLAWFSRFLPDRPLVEASYDHYFIDAKVSPESPLVGRTIEQNSLRHLESLFLVEIVRAHQLISPVSQSEVIAPGDRLVFSGDITKVTQLNQFTGLDTFAESNGLLGGNLTEVVLRPDSVLIGKTLKATGFRARFDAAVVALRRDGAPLSGKLGEVILKAGDFLVLAVGDDFKHRDNLTKNFITVSGVETEDHLSGYREWFAVAGFVIAVGLAALGVFSLFKSMFLLLGALIMAGCLSPNELIRRFPKDLWLIVAGALMLSQALGNTELLELLRQQIDRLFDPSYIWPVMIGIYLCTWLFTELVTNNAAAALMFPIAYGLAQVLGVNPLTFTMLVAFAASASFISPYGYQTNLMVYNAGRYSLGDFAKVGFPVAVVYGMIVVIAIPYFFPF